MLGSLVWLVTPVEVQLSELVRLPRWQSPSAHDLSAGVVRIKLNAVSIIDQRSDQRQIVVLEIETVNADVHHRGGVNIDGRLGCSCTPSEVFSPGSWVDCSKVRPFRALYTDKDCFEILKSWPEIIWQLGVLKIKVTYHKGTKHSTKTSWY